MTPLSHVTADDLIKSGACYSGVYKVAEKFFNLPASIPVETALKIAGSNKQHVVAASKIDGDGGYGNGYGGNGYGDGCYGNGYGDGCYGNGYGGNGYGGNGDGGYGDGCYGDGCYGDGHDGNGGYTGE